MMEIIVQWATILSPIIAVVLAWWMSRSGARDTAKMVATIKELTQMQFKLTCIQVEKELLDAEARYELASKREKEMDEKISSLKQVGWYDDTMPKREEKKKDFSSEREYQMKHLDVLHNMCERLDTIQKSIISK